MALLSSYHHVTEINMDKTCIDSKRTELIRRWMNCSKKNGPACWWTLVKALEEKSVNMIVAAEKIRADHSNNIVTNHMHCISGNFHLEKNVLPFSPG